MHRSTRRALATLGAGAAAIAAAPAIASASPTESSTGSLTAAHVVHMNYTAQRAANSEPFSATGQMDGTIQFGSATPIAASGPITCLDNRGNKAGMFVKLTGTKPTVMGKVMRGMLLTVENNGAGRATSMSFIPMAVDHVSGCMPLVGMMPAGGTATSTNS